MQVFGWTIWLFSAWRRIFFSSRWCSVPRIFAVHSRINPFYSRNFTFITQEITNTLLKKFEGPNPSLWGAVKWKLNTGYKVTMEFVLLKVIVRSVNTFIPLGDETINSSLVERGRSLMNPQPHPLLCFFVRMKPTSTNVIFQVAKNVEVTKGKIWPVRRMLKCFPAKTLKLIPHYIDSMGTGVIMQKDDSVLQHSRTFWLYSASQHPQPRTNEPHTVSLLFFACLYFQCCRNTLYTTITSAAIKKQLCEAVHFQYAYLLPYRWQYWYVKTVLPAFARNVFYGGYSVFIWLPVLREFWSD